jgi:hypothetical protein
MDKPKLKHPATILADLANLLKDKDEKGFSSYLDSLSKEEVMHAGQFTDALQEIFLDTLARLEINEPLIIVPNVSGQRVNNQ